MEVLAQTEFLIRGFGSFAVKINDLRLNKNQLEITLTVTTKKKHRVAIFAIARTEKICRYFGIKPGDECLGNKKEVAFDFLSFLITPTWDDPHSSGVSFALPNTSIGTMDLIWWIKTTATFGHSRSN
jgi:hypothetical protein